MYQFHCSFTKHNATGRDFGSDGDCCVVVQCNSMILAFMLTMIVHYNVSCCYYCYWLCFCHHLLCYSRLSAVSFAAAASGISVFVTLFPFATVARRRSVNARTDAPLHTYSITKHLMPRTTHFGPDYFALRSYPLCYFFS